MTSTWDELVRGPRGYELISGVYRNKRQEDLLWFAHRRPAHWSHLDVETRSNGDLFTEVDGVPRAFLLVDGAVAAESGQRFPGVRRLHAMVEYGLYGPREPEPWPEPDEVESTTWEGRPAARLRWGPAEIVVDAATAVVVRMHDPRDMVEITDIRFDDDVDEVVLVPPERTIDLPRGGVAYVSEVGRNLEGFSASWSLRSGPGNILVLGPRNVSREEAVTWARERSDDVRFQAHEAGGPPHKLPRRRLVGE